MATAPARPNGSKALYVPWIVAVLPFVLMVAWFWDRGPGLTADDYGLTLSHASAIVDGRPYGDTGFIATPLDQAASVQPPGLPMVVAVAMKLTGGYHEQVIKLLMVATAFPFFLLAGLHFARGHGRAMGLTVMAMLIVSVTAEIPHGATHVQSDLGFASLIWGTIFLLDRDRPFGWPTVLAVFALACGAVAYRAVGAAVIVAITLFTLLNRDRLARRLLVPTAVWAAGGLALIALGGWATIAHQLSFDPVWILEQLPRRIRFYGAPAAEAHLYPFPWDGANDVFHALSLSLAVAGIVSWSRTSWRSGAWLFMASYLLVLFMAYARADRYLVPLYPMLIFGLLHAVRSVAAKVGESIGRLRPAAVAAGFGMTVAGAGLVVLMATEPRSGDSLAELGATRAMFDYLSNDRGPDTRVAWTQPRVLSWHTGISAMTIPEAPPEEMFPELERLRISHVIVDRLPLGPERTRSLQETIATYECRFDREFTNRWYDVYRLRPDCPT